MFVDFSASVDLSNIQINEYGYLALVSQRFAILEGAVSISGFNLSKYSLNSYVRQINKT